MTTEIQHALMVKQLWKPGKDVLASLDPVRADLLHATIGIAGEAGELLDAIKKHVIYNKALDITNVIEEIGDIEYYLGALRMTLGITREETLDANFVKLQLKRYPKGYSDQAAQERADKWLDKVPDNKTEDAQ